jgi:E1A/CREB-binding protein
MDLGTIRKRLDGGHYRTMKAFFSDVRLVWSNALVYNPPGSEVHIIATKMQRGAEQYLELLESRWNERHAKRAAAENCCSLCGGGEFLLEPPTLYCNQCSSRIKKGVQYYTTVSNKYHLCTACYTTARRTGLDLYYDGQHVSVAQLAKRKIESDDREAWVECNNCKKWQHQVCTLYNGRRCEGTDIPHYCPQCLLGHITARGSSHPIAKPVRGAKALPTTRLSDLIEFRLRALLEARRGVLAGEQEVEPAAVELPDLTVRLVSCLDKTLLVQPEFYERYRAQGYPSQFNYRSKALMLWQKLGGVDVFIYGVFVQEYGDDCAQPNRRSAYLSYLDSAKYLDPPVLRTEVYHEILIAYLDDLRTVSGRPPRGSPLPPPPPLPQSAPGPLGVSRGCGAAAGRDGTRGLPRGCFSHPVCFPPSPVDGLPHTPVSAARL